MGKYIGFGVNKGREVDDADLEAAFDEIRRASMEDQQKVIDFAFDGSWTHVDYKRGEYYGNL